MANSQKRNFSTVYNSLKQISDEEGIDFGLDGLSEEDFKKKYFTGPGNINNLYNKLSQISDEEGIDFGLGTRGEWLGSFGFTEEDAKPRQGYRPSEREMAGFQSTINSAGRVASNPTQSYDRKARLMQKRQGIHIPQRVNLGESNNLTPTEQRFNIETGEIEHGYMTSAGNEYDNRTIADMEQRQIDQAQRDERYRQTLPGQLKDAYAERDRLKAELSKYQGSWVDQDGRVHYNNRGNEESVASLEAALRQNQQRITALEAERDDDGGTQFWRGFIDAAKNPSVYSFGLTDFKDMMQLMRIKNKVDTAKSAGKQVQLSPAEQQLMESTYLNNYAQSAFGENRGFMYRAGGISMQALPFVAEFMTTGGFSALSQGGARLGAQAAEKLALNGLKKTLVKNLGVVAGDVAAGWAMANTTGLFRTAGDVMKRNIGDVAIDENGDLGFKDGKSLGRSIYEAEVANTLEYYTEKLGEHLKLGKRLAKGAEKMGLSRLSKVANYLSGNKWLEAGGIQDYPSEVIEEQANLLLNAALVGDNTFTGPDDPKSVINKNTQLDIWGGMLFSIGLMQAPRAAYTATNAAGYYAYKKNVDISDGNAAIVFGRDNWDMVKEQIDNCDNDKLPALLESIVNGNMQPEQKTATLNYAGNLIKMRGYNMGMMAGAKDEEESAKPEAIVSQAISQGYQAGRQAQMPEEMKLYIDEAEAAREHLPQFGKEFANMVTSQDPVETLSYLMNNRNFFDDDQIAAAADYYQKSARANGVMDAAEDNVDIQVEQANAEVRANTHQATGNVIMAKGDGDVDYYVIGGDVVTDEQGLTSLVGTGGAVVVKDPVTGEVSVKSPAELMVYSVQNADEMIQQNETTLRDGLMQQADDDITFGSPANEVFDIEDTVALQDGEGGIIEGQVVQLPNSVDGVFVIQTADGRALQMTADDMNRRIVGHNGMEVQRASNPTVEQQPQPTEQEREEQPTEQEEEPTALSRIPVKVGADGKPVMNKKGSPVLEWHKASVEDAASALIETTGGDMLTARDTASDLVNVARGKLEKIRKQKPKGEDPIEIAQSRQEIKRQEQEQQDIIKQWQNVNQEIQRRMQAESAARQAEIEAAKSEEQRQREAEEARQLKERQDEIARQRIREQIERDRERNNREYAPLVDARKEMAGDEEALAVLSDTEPRSLEEFVSSLIRPHSMLWLDASESEIGLQSELGLKRNDMQRFMTLLGTKESGAKPFGKVVLDIYEGLTDAMKEQYTDEDVRRTLLDLFNEGSSTRMMHLTEENRISEAREIARENERRAEEAEMEAWAEAYHLTPEERETFEEWMQLPPSEPEQEVINQIILENEQNRNVQRVDQQPVTGTGTTGVEGSQGQVQGETETTGNGNDAAAVAQGTQTTTGESSVSGDEVHGGASDREALAILLDQVGGNPILAQRMSDYEVEQLTAMVDDWDAVNSDYGYIIEREAKNLKSKDKSVRDAAQQTVNEAQARANEAFEPIEQYVENLTSKYIPAEDEEFEGAMPKPEIDKPRMMAIRQALTDGYSRGDAAAIAAAAKQVQYYVDEGLDDYTQYEDGMEDYDGNDPSKLADQYIARVFQDRYLDDDADQEYIKTGLKQSMRENNPENISESQENLVSLHGQNNEGNGNQGTGQENSPANNTSGWGKRLGLRAEAQGKRPTLGSRWDTGVYEEGLASGQTDSGSNGSRAALRQESERIINIAKEVGDYIPPSELPKFGVRYVKPTGESTVYMDVDNNRVVKVKNPFAYTSLKNDNPYQALYEHHIHNFFFPNVPYRLIGISEDEVDGLVRFVFEQPFVETAQERPTDEEIKDWFEKHGFKQTKDKYWFTDGYVSFTDVWRDNCIKDVNGNLCFIDPIIKFEKDPLEVIQHYLEQGTLGATSSSEEIAAQEAQVDTNPSDAQKEAGNYQKGHIKVDGYDITIENPKGSTRSGVDANGNPWETEMHNTYGYIRGTEGVDGDHIDVFLSDNPTSGNVYVIDQVNDHGDFDEHKVMYGFASEEEARQAYLSNYSEGWQGLGTITEVSREDFKKWVQSSHRKTKPFAEYKAVKKKAATKSQPTVKKPKEHKRLVSDDKMEELRKQLLAKMNNTNVGIDPERMLLGAMYAVGKIERGFTKFADYAAEMVNDLGDMIRPYLKSFYNAVRDMPEAQEYAGEMDDYDTVQEFDVFNFDKQGKVPTVIEKAEQVSKEQKVKRDAKKVKKEQPDLFAGSLFDAELMPQPAEQETKQEPAAQGEPKYRPLTEADVDNDNPVVYYKGEPSHIMLITRTGEQTSATTFSKPHITSIMLTNGKSVKLEDLMIRDDVNGQSAKPKPKTAWWSDPNRPQSLDPSDYRTYMTDEARNYFASHPAFSGWKRKDLAFITAAVWDGVVVPYEALKNLPEIVAAEQIVKDATANGVLHISDEERDQHAQRLLDAEHGSAIFENGKIKKVNGVEDFSGPVRQERKALFIIGYPAAGKSSVFANRLSNEHGARIIDSDTVKPWLKGFDGGNGAGYVQEASSEVAERAIDIAVGKGDNIILPRIGGGSVIALSAALKLSGYDVQLYFNDVATNTSVDRATSRFAETGRYLSLQYLTSKDGVPSKNFSNFALKTLGDYVKELSEGKVQELRGRLARLLESETIDGKRLWQSLATDQGGYRTLDEYVSVLLEPRGTGVTARTSDLIFSYSEWKSNDVAFGEKPKEIWNSKSGKPMPNKKGANNDARNLRQVGEENRRGSNGVSSGESSVSGSADNSGLESDIQERRDERQGDTGVSQGDGTISSSSAGQLRPVQGLTQQQPAQPKQAPKQNNKRNNIGERGMDYAPTSPKARFNANVEAIKMMRALMDEGIEAPTKDQMEVLRQYSGWGGLGTYFNDETSAENKILRDLLDDEEYNDAVMSVNSAYFTPATVIDSLWDIAKALGFKGGNVLEGSAGIGNIIGQMPKEMSRQSDIEAVEIDKITGNILKLLYPDAKVRIQGFQDTVIRNGSVDLAITNVPFVTGLHVIDKVDKDLSRRFANIHDFCIAKNIRKLREGGIGIFITSSGTLDKSNDLRAWITDEGQTDVIGAFRLNNETFGGTKVTSDIIVVRKRIAGRTSEHGIDVSKTSPLKVGTYEDKYGEKHQTTMVINDYFKEHPEMMAGEMAFGYEKGDTFRPGSYGLFPVEGKDQTKMLAQFVKGMKNNAVAEPQRTVETTEEEANQLTAVKEGRMLLDDKGRLCVSRMGEAIPLGLNDQKVKGQTKQQCFKEYQAVQAAVDDVLQQQLNDPNDEALKPKLAALNKAYDLFVKRYGTLHKNTAISFLRNDIDFPSFQALEIYKEEKDIKGKVIVKTSKPKLFTERVIGFKTEPQPKSVKDAVIASIFRSNGIDLEWIAAKLSEVAAPPNGGNWTADDVRKGILVSRLGFEDPSTGQLVIRYKYLSGNVREKLVIAEQYNAEGETAGRYAANVEELRKAVPMDIPAHLIDFSLGSSWIPVELYKDFVKETLDLGNVSIVHFEGSWSFNEGYSFHNEKNRVAGVYSEKFHETIYGHQLVAAALNNRPVKVSKQVTEGYGSSKTTRTVVDQAATQACAVRLDEIKDEFKQWAKKKMQDDPELARRIEKIYNDKFNAMVPMEIGDEFLPEIFDGANQTLPLYGHQKRGVMRGVTAPTMLAHEVGTGKSFTLITTAMEMRRLGTAKKPMIVVQNATVAQMTADAKLLYPNAKVLSLSEQDRDAEGRRAFYAKIKYNDWDIIIVPQSTFERIPDSPERELQFIQEKIDEKKHVIEAARAAGADERDMKRLKRELEKIEEEYGDVYLDNDPVNKEFKSKKKDAKREAASLDKVQTRAKEQLDRATDDVQYFDDLGIDALLVDEAHEYKHLGFQTSIGRGIKGIDPSYSKKCAGLYIKTRSVFEKAGWKNVVFATGTPISNTAAEIWTFMKYLMPADVMKANDIYYFDDFVHNFGNISQMLEFTTSGKFKENTRFAAYVNKPELIRIWSQVADTVLTKEVGKVQEKIPEMEGGKDQDVFLPQSPSLIRIMAAVRAELERFENMTGQEKKENSSIPLTMYGIAKRAAIDPRLVDADAPDEPMSKTNAAFKEIVKDLKATESYKGTVAVFCDNQNRLGVNAAGKKVVEFNIYDDMKEKLIKAGVPEKQIAIIKSGMSITAKQKIFDAVNSGEIRVVLGSTQTLGTGVNMQERLHLLIHMDAPDRPMDYTQRNGRIKRQGNLHKQWGKTIRVIRFGVEDSLDVTAYQRLKTKSGFIDSIMDGKASLANNQVDRTVEEEEEGLFDNPVAVLSGSQYALKKNQAERELRKYQGKKAQWEADQVYVANQLRHDANMIEADKATIVKEQKELERIKQMFPTGTVKTITVEGVKIDMTKDDGAKKLGEAIKEKINDPVNAIVKRNRENAIYNDEVLEYTISFDGHDVNFRVEVVRESVYDNGKMKTVIHKYTSYKWPELNIETLTSSRGVRDYLDEILDQVITGRDNQDRIDAMQQNIERLNAEIEQIKKRVGMPFQFAKELEEAQKHVEEYTELMKKEMKEKEAKYAEQQKEAEAEGNGFNLSKAEEQEDEDLYSADEDWDESVYRDMERFAEGESFPIHTRMAYSSYNVLGDRPSYYTDLMPDEYATKQALVDALRNQYPEYFVSLEGSSVRMESWQHALEAATELQQTRQAKGSESYANRKTRNAINAINRMAERMRLDVEVLTSIEGLKGKKARAKGWFNEKTGKIVIVLPNHSNSNDLINTLLHEGVAHFGLRKLFGPHFDTFLDNVYNNVSPEIKARVDAAMKRNGWSRHEATEEYLARLAERTDFEHATQQGWWQKIKQFFLNMLIQAGIHMPVKLADNDLRYILWRSYDNLLHPDSRRSLFDIASEVTMKQRLGINRYAKERERLQRTGRIDTSRIAAERVSMYAAADALIDSLRKNAPKNLRESLSVSERVSMLPVNQLQYAYKKVNDMMLDEDGLNLDDHFEKVKRDWINEHGFNGVGKLQADELKKATDMYGEGLITLRWELMDRMDNLGMSYESSVAESDRVKEEMLNRDFDDKSSQELLLSLSQKDENGRNETVNELIRRVREGEARIVRMGQEIPLDRENDAQIAGAIFGGLRQLGLSPLADETLRSVVSGGREVVQGPSAQSQNTPSDIELAIISWAKATGHYYSEVQVKESSLDKRLYDSGAESRVYRSADGQKVIKFFNVAKYYDNALLKHIDDLALQNSVGFEPVNVIGYSYDPQLGLMIVLEQNFVDGVTVDDIFDDEPLSRVHAYIDAYLEEVLGLERHEDEDGNLYHTKKGLCYTDIHGGNMIVDSRNNRHIIDCHVEREDDRGRERAGDFAIEDEEKELFSIRTKEPPKKTGKGYKVFVLKDGQLYPPMVANPNGEGTPIGVWLDADAAPIAGQSKTGRPQVKAGGKGTQGGSGQLAYRPGWHLGTIPYALQFNRKDANGERTLFPNNFVWAEVEYADDVDYQDEARREGMNANGKYQHSLAGLKHLPTDGSYKYRTNPDPRTDEWIITGAMRVNRILSRAEVDELVRKAGREPQPIQEGDVLTQEAVDRLNAEIQATEEADEMGLLFRDDSDIALDSYNEQVAKESLKWVEAWQDSMVGLKAIQDAIAKETGKAPTGAENAYLFENRMHGRAKNMTEQYDYRFYRPMLKAFSDFCKKANLSQQQGLEYLISKSGLERNMYYAFRDGMKEKVTDEVNEERDQLEKEYAKGKLTEEDYKLRKSELEERERTGVDDAMQQVRQLFPYQHAKVQYNSGAISYSEYLRIVENVIRTQLKRRTPKKDGEGNVISDNYYDDNVKDYSGLTETFAKDMYDDAQEVKRYAQRVIDPRERRMLWSQYNKLMKQAYESARQVADDAVFGAESSHHDMVSDLWNKINAATKETLKHSYEGGLIDRENYHKVQQMFDFYIPLRGWEEDKASDVYTYMGRDNVFSPAVKKTWGRTSKAENPLAYIGNIAVSTILSSHRNQMKQHFLNYVMNNPTSLVSISESWYENIGDDDNPIWILRSADTAGRNPDEIVQIVNDFNEEMREKQAEGLAMPVKGRLRLGLNATQGQKAEHVVEVQRAGHTYQLYINGDPKAAQALNGTNSKAVSRISDTYLGRKITDLNRSMAAFFTSKNPAFVISNLSRDLNMAGASVLIKEGKKYNEQFIANVAKVLSPRIAAGDVSKEGWRGLIGKGRGVTGLMPKLLAKWKSGKLNTADETERLFKEFMDEGGETGFVNMLSVDSFKEKMQKEIGQMNGASLFGSTKSSRTVKEASVTKALRLLGDTFEFYNRCAEDATRFIVYMTSRQMGKSLEDAIADAKDVTLNFNRKGTGDKGNAEIRDLFIFVNPAIQALSNMYKMMKGKPLKFGAVTAAFVAGGALMPIINQWLLNMFGDDDDKNAYWNLPPWVRKNNLVFWVPGTKNFVTIPLAQEFRVFYGVGEMISSGIQEHPVDKLGLEVFSSVADLVPINPTGNGGNLLIDFSPTFWQPLAQIGSNVDFTGKPIWRENQGNKYAPMYTKAYISTPGWMVKVSETINNLTGGNEGKKGVIENYSPFWGDYINNPAVWNHLLQGYFGGMYNTIAKAFDVGVTVGSGEMPKIYQTPIINRFLNRPVERDNAGVLGDDYHSLIEQRDALQYELRVWNKKAADGDENAQQHVNEIMASDDWKRAGIITHYERIIKELRAGEKATSEKEEKQLIKEGESMYKQQMLEELAAVSDGRDPLEVAMESFKNAKTLAEKDKLRMRIERLTQNSASKQKSSRSDVDKAMSYLQESDTENGAQKRYLELATAENIRDDARIRTAKGVIKQYTDEYKRLMDEGNSSEASAYRLQNMKWFQADNIIKANSRAFNSNKRLLGKGQDKALMRMMDTSRKAMIDAIDELVI